MSRATTTLVVIFGLLATIVVGWLLVLGAAVALGGVLTVEVIDRSEGLDLYIPIPIALVDAVLESASTPELYTAGLPSVEVDGVAVDLGEIGPFALELFEELDGLPDVTLIEAQDGLRSVRVYKAGGKLRIEVEEPGSSVEIALPTRGARRLAGRILG